MNYTIMVLAAYAVIMIARPYMKDLFLVIQSCVPIVLYIRESMVNTLQKPKRRRA